MSSCKIFFDSQITSATGAAMIIESRFRGAKFILEARLKLIESTELEVIVKKKDVEDNCTETETNLNSTRLRLNLAKIDSDEAEEKKRLAFNEKRIASERLFEEKTKSAERNLKQKQRIYERALNHAKTVKKQLNEVNQEFFVIDHGFRRLKEELSEINTKLGIVAKVISRFRKIMLNVAIVSETGKVKLLFKNHLNLWVTRER